MTSILRGRMPPAGRSLSLRTTVVGLVAFVGVYVAALALYMGVVVRPEAAVLQARTAGRSTVYQNLDARVRLLSTTVGQIRDLAGVANRIGPDSVRVVSRDLRVALDSATVFSASNTLAAMPLAMRSALAQAMTNESTLLTLLNAALAELEVGEVAQAQARIRGEGDRLVAAIAGRIRQAQSFGFADLIANQEALGRAARSVEVAVTLWLGLGALLLGSIYLLLKRRAFEPLAEIDRGLARVAAGDLEVRVPVRRRDEIGQVADQFNQMITLLREQRELERKEARGLIDRMGHLVDEASNELYVIDARNLRFLMVNRGARENLGYSAEDLRAMTPANIAQYRTMDDLRILMAPLLDGEVSQLRSRGRHTRKDGTTYPVELTMEVFRDEDPPVILVFGEDITARQQQEEALRRSEERFAKAFRSSPDALTISDGEGRFVDVNDGFTAICGWTRQEVLGKTAKSLDLWTDLRQRDALVRQVFGGESVRNLALDIRTRDGSLRSCLMSADLIELEGSPHMLAVTKDVSDLRQVERALQRREVVLEAIGACADSFLRASDWETAVNESLTRLGEATDVSGVALFENRVTGDGDLRTTLHAEWSAHTEPPTTAWQGISFRRVGLAHWAEALDRDETVVVTADDLTEAEHDALVHRGAANMVLVPIRAVGRWWGFLEFDHREAERGWSPAGLSALRAAAGIFSAAIERREAETTLRESETRFRALIENSSDLITLVDPEGKFRYHSPSVVRILGYEQGELYGRHFRDFIHPDDLASAEKSFRTRLLEHHDRRQVMFRFRHKNGSWVRLDTIGQSFAEDPAIRAVVYNSRDITEREHVAEALRESEERFRNAFEYAPIGIVVMLLDGTILEANARFCTLVRAESSALKGRSLLDVTHPEDREATRTMLSEAIGRPEQVRGLEQRYLTADGQVVHARLSTILERDSARRPVRFVSLVEDVSVQRELTEQLRQSQKMDAVGQLAGGIAHDFNNLLTVILAHASFAEESFAPTDIGRKDVEAIVTAAKRATELTRQLLTFARKQVTEPRIVSVNDLLTDLEKMLRRVLGESVSLETRLYPEVWLVKVDPGQFEQVILNMAVNARDAMPDGGRLELRTANAQVDDIPGAGEVLPSGDLIEISLHDTGQGMSAEVLAHIFEPFFTTKAVGKGTGLGLATCYGIVRQAGGHILVSSTLGEGSTFRILLPRAAGAKPAASPARDTVPLGRGETILVVEDDPQLRLMVSRVLSRIGYTVHLAGTAQEAFALVRELGPLDLLLTDVVLPGKSGREIAEQLRHRQPGLRVLFMSGYTEDTILREGIRDEGIDFLPKPFNPSTLARRVRASLDGERVRAR